VYWKIPGVDISLIAQLLLLTDAHIIWPAKQHRVAIELAADFRTYLA
jgi:hypothetical protein